MGGPRWSEAELAALEEILDRAPDGLETARNREIVTLSETIDRTRIAIVQKLFLVRKTRRRGDE